MPTYRMCKCARIIKNNFYDDVVEPCSRHKYKLAHYSRAQITTPKY